ncbi:hypothetical protein CASbig_65 [Mycobacterium phage CASbig]|uniref:hypothetical protein n=1 Tax=Mycobacterium phage CASbig TaxID=1327035 RepID=UPI00032B8687|nr:hypothetical protein JMN56_gp65 [Mycobacterium phage CASbig]AGK88108.1 hypothetical protein CASbig_65 [Mycobacterium phage CASbig]
MSMPSVMPSDAMFITARTRPVSSDPPNAVSEPQPELSTMSQTRQPWRSGISEAIPSISGSPSSPDSSANGCGSSPWKYRRHTMVSCESARTFFAVSWNDLNRENTIVSGELSARNGNGLTMLRQLPGFSENGNHSEMSNGLSGSVHSEVSRRRMLTNSVSSSAHFAGPNITHSFGNWNSGRRNGFAHT